MGVVENTQELTGLIHQMMRVLFHAVRVNEMWGELLQMEVANL
ncbi:MAG: hypothetical protein WCC06_03545 [Candidatus Aminicenantales bacterium]